jgi:exosome complex component RRP42
MSEVRIPNIQAEKIKEYLSEGKRLDGREVTQMRDLIVEREISKNAESAVSVKLGNTHVYCGVKMSVVEPYSDSPNEGTFMTTAELHPMSSEKYDLGKPGINAIELARVIDRGIRESGLLDFRGLCIKEGEKVWQVFLDIVAINDDGNLFDVAGIAGLIALASAKLPKYNEEENKIEHEFTDNPIPLNKDALSVNFTLHKVGNQVIVDPSFEEELISDYRLSIAIADNKGNPRITAMQKGKEEAITTEEMNKILEIVSEIHSKTLPGILDIIWENK